MNKKITIALGFATLLANYDVSGTMEASPIAKPSAPVSSLGMPVSGMSPFEAPISVTPLLDDMGEQSPNYAVEGTKRSNNKILIPLIAIPVTIGAGAAIYFYIKHNRAKKDEKIVANAKPVA